MLASTFGPPVALLEREPALERAGDVVERAAAGHGGVLVVEGPAGIGKTSVLSAAREAAAAEGMRVLHGRGAQLEREFAFGLVRQLFDPVLGGLPVEDRSVLLAGPAGAAGRLLGLPGAAAEPAHVRGDPGFALMHGLYWLLAGLAEEHGALVAVDDAHWADVASLRFLAFLATRLQELPVALVVAARPGSGAAEDIAATLGTAERVQLPPLSPDAVGMLLGADGALAAVHHDATGGNPFLIGQLAVALREERPVSGRIGSEAVGRWALSRAGGPSTPTARLLRAGAVLEEADLPVAAALADLDLDDATLAADELAAAGILAAGRPLRFVHALVRAGVYARISGAQRTAGHLEAAKLLDEHDRRRAAEHLLAVEPTGSEWVAARLVEAGRTAAAAGAPESAAAYLRRALAEPSRETGRVLLELGLAESALGEAGAIERLQAAFDAGGGGEAALVLAHALGRAHRYAEAVRAIDRAAEGHADGPLALMLEVAAVTVGMISADTAPALAPRLRALRARAGPGAPRELLAVAALAAVEANEPAATGAELARAALAAGPRALPEPTDLPWFSQASVALIWAERWDEVAPVLDAAAEEAAVTADPALYAVALSHRAWLELRRGDLLSPRPTRA